MADLVLSLTEFSRGLAGFLRQVQYQGQSFSIRRGTELVARVSPGAANAGVPLDQIDALLATGPQLNPQDRQAMADDLQSLRQARVPADDPWDS